MPIPVTGSVGTPGASYSPGATPPVAQDNFGAVLASEYQGRFSYATYQGKVFGFGMTSTAINNATFTTATLGATCTPILGVWNPVGNPVNLHILQASLALVLTALQATGGGPFVWAVSTGNAGITTGSVPWNRKSLAQSGSAAKAFAASPALTGLTNNLVVMDGADFANITYAASELATAAGFQTAIPVGVQNFDGNLIVPPGGVLALLGTTTGVANSAAGRITWAEFPV